MGDAGLYVACLCLIITLDLAVPAALAYAYLSLAVRTLFGQALTF
jgi:hypothetical protein